MPGPPTPGPYNVQMIGDHHMGRYREKRMQESFEPVEGVDSRELRWWLGLVFAPAATTTPPALLWAAAPGRFDQERLDVGLHAGIFRSSGRLTAAITVLLRFRNNSALYDKTLTRASGAGLLFNQVVRCMSHAVVRGSSDAVLSVLRRL